MDISFEFTLSQTQNVSLNTVQFMALLQMNAMELSKYIENVLLENPTLEADVATSASFGTGKSKLSRKKNADAYGCEDPVALFGSCEDRISLFDEVRLQIRSARTPLEPVALCIASFLDANGFISEHDFGCISKEYGKHLTDEALTFVQSLYPTGLAARSVSERLVIQLRKEGSSPLAEIIASSYIDELSKHKYSYISKATGNSLDDILNAVSEILALEPFPFAEYDTKPNIQYIVPDIMLDKSGNLFVADEWLPKLNVSDYYKKMLSECDDSEVKKYLSEKLRNASWLINSLSRRKETLIQCTRAIINRQSAFFESEGNAMLVPLTQKDIAEMLNVHASTVCRLVNTKYLQCPFGTYPLSRFFCASVRADSGDTTPVLVKKRIDELIMQESESKPLSDQKIMEILVDEGISVSRRTIAKYRTAMKIPGRTERKNLYRLSNAPLFLK